jgi:hypothetical protein
MNDVKRLKKLEKLLADKKITHSNPVEIGIADLEMLVHYMNFALIYQEIDEMDQELELSNIETSRLRAKN